MKKLLVLFLGVCSLNLFASGEDKYDSFVCKSKQTDMIVILQKKSDYFDHSNKKWEWWAKYQVTITSPTSKYNKGGFASLGNARGEDVYFEYGARKKWNNKSVSFNMWLDEMDQSSLIIGDKSYRYNCVTFADLD